jgi:hypothetical protein
LVLRKHTLIFLFCLFAAPAIAQVGEKPSFARRYIYSLINDTADIRKPQFLIYPTVAFAPETSWEFGVSTLYVYYANRDTTNRLSEISGFSFITLENQYGFWFDHALYTDQNTWFFLGRNRYQRFPLLYYGVGPDAPEDYISRVDANFLLLKERALRKISGSLYGGLEFDLESLHRVNIVAPENAPLDSNLLPLGYEGSTNFGVGLGLIYDDRHNVLNVRHGTFAELAFLRYDKTWGSDFDFTSIIFDSRLYRPVNRRDVFAAQLFGQFTTAGDAPFNQLALMGGESLMRGYYLGRYRDNNLIAGQVEYRMLPFPFAKRWGAAAFLSSGTVFSAFDQLKLNQFVVAGGAGVRFLLFPQKDIYTRLDVAFTGEGMGFYFFIGEAF